MRPLKLIMQAFGPFPSRIEIPFEKLPQNSIYLISGVTGSGKTTIFDAVSYALFNCASGSNRTSSAFRSHFAKESVESFVEFEFLFNDKIYNIKRYPSYERKKTRGEGVVLVSPRAAITLPDGKIIEKPKEVDEYIKVLLGMNAQQFSQIALLAQGEFLKLLNADSTTRAEVFRNIFKTWSCANFQNKIREETILYKNKYESAKSSILQCIEDVCSSDSKILELKEMFLENSCFDSLENFISLLKNQNKSDEAELLKIKNNITSIEEEVKSLQEEFLKIQAKASLLAAKEKTKEEILKKESELKEIKPEYESLKDKKQKLQKLALEIKKADDDYKKSVKINELKKEQETLELDKKQLESDIQKFGSDLLNLKIDYLKSSYSCYLNSQKEYESKKDEFLNFQKESKSISELYLKSYNEYLQIQAGIIAQGLEDNAPCPVCGSLNHPKPAKLLNKNLSKEYIDKLKNDSDMAQKKLSDLAIASSSLLERSKAQKENYDNLLKKYKLEIDEIEYDVSNLDYDKEISHLEDTMNSSSKELVAMISNLKTKENEINSLLSEIKNKDTDEILNFHSSLLKKYASFEKEILKIESDYNLISSDIKSLKSNIELLSSQLLQYEKINLDRADEINIKIEEHKNNILEAQNIAQNVLVRLAVNKKALDSIVLKNSEYEKISSIYSDYKILSDCANGNLKGAQRIPFEQYIQGYYLDMVLNEANKHLKVMTQNQFQLLRKTDAASMQSKTGLDLEVMDFHTFKKRSTKTLSGGESFKAALSLALGLSDCASNLSGALNIDSMFIDEGFGSLDSDSIELAIDVIFNLANNNRLIGIISHIEDLKSKVQNQITAIKTIEGSKISVNF